MAPFFHYRIRQISFHEIGIIRSPGRTIYLKKALDIPDAEGFPILISTD
jgi:hypothetical protein